MTPFQQPEWMLAWWQQFQTPRRQLFVLTITDDSGDLVGLAPCYVSHHLCLGRSVHFLGDGRACSDFQCILSLPGYQQQVAQAAADWLVKSRDELRWNALEFDGVSADEPLMAHFADRIRELNCSVHIGRRDHTWRLDVTDGWKGFMSRLSKNQNSQIRNLINRLDKNPSLHFESHCGHESLQSALQTCMDLHGKRWRASGQEGCFNDPRFCKFVQAACTQFVERHQVGITVLRHDGLAVACQLFLRDEQENRFIYQSGRDPDFDHMKVGHLLNLAAIREAVNQGVEFIDYLRGDEVYKPRLSAQPTACQCLRVVAPEAIAHLQDSIHVAGRTALSAIQSRVRSWSLH